jgi:hypothetical protein
MCGQAQVAVVCRIVRYDVVLCALYDVVLCALYQYVVCY